ncbi:hypothetical protein [Mycobacteroides franklinii]|uniref:YtkA-like domain-containing protein n=1 Tax=Mycobacteroides franklinii TaxID=948102 RepID=A0A4R8RBZ0_9MYCO|nr:hypothetical protein [Mycobacteroides franklinii]TDZ42290.1 hypothetical protein CCUG64054_02334 [Mycobacteroides franklinii]TDZ52438.1 hypothetical protein CCUG63697_00919 [Mycobacteroides franklinii]TDZ55845.1 hypothetical protein CCUG63696_02336 [Mycobacteroides franklinii]TDZ62786.1 hypothetical protein CCUG63695_02261 [Mycobacteroides franklinii]TDZ69183.1 hypothetical protein CCUG64056_02334 [Mycobacteroides franklinii]
MTRRVWAGLALIVAAVLTLTWIAWPSPPKAVTLYSGTEHYSVTMTVDNPRVGMTALEIAVEEREDHDLPESEPVTVELVMPLMGHAMPALREVVSGRTKFDQVMLSMAGPWEVVVTITPPSGDPDERATMPLWVSGG